MKEKLIKAIVILIMAIMILGGFYTSLSLEPRDEVLKEPSKTSSIVVETVDSVKEKVEEETPQIISIGEYELTAYCSCVKCCGQWSGGPTASGTMPVAGRTIACNFLPFGAQVVINGHTYTVEDTGNMGNSVFDVYCDSHEAAYEFGRQRAEVFVIHDDEIFW